MQKKSFLSLSTTTQDPPLQGSEDPINVSLAFFSVTTPPQPPKVPRYVLYGKADIDLEWKGFLFRIQSLTWRVHRNNGKIIVIFPNQSYPDPQNQPGKKQKRYSVPTFTVLPEKGYRDLYPDIVECIQKEVRKHFGSLIDEYMKTLGTPYMWGKVSQKVWFLKPRYEELRELERHRWDNPPGNQAPDPIDVSIIEIYEDIKCIEGKSTGKYAIKGTAHIAIKFDGYTFEIRNLFWGIKHKSYEVRVKSSKSKHGSQHKSPTKRFITLGFRAFSPKGYRDLHLKIVDALNLEIVRLYNSDIQKQKRTFQRAYEAIRNDIKRRRRLAEVLTKKSKRKESKFA